MSNSDDQLDALYKQLAADDPASRSPQDLDDLLRAAATESVVPNQDPEAPEAPATGIGWQRRYGWATAATLLLTSALFLSLPETAPQRSDAPAAFATDELQAPRKNLAPPAEFADESPAGTGVISIVTPRAESRAEAATITTQPQPSGSVRVAVEPAQAAPQVQMPEAPPPPQIAVSEAYANDALLADNVELQDIPARDTEAVTGAPAPSRRLAKSSDAMARHGEPTASKMPRASADRVTAAPARTIEEIVVTGAYQSSPCEDYENSLITQVCPTGANTYTLTANRLSRCAGQTLEVQSDEALRPHSSSDKGRFVIESADGELQALTCKQGKLRLQSLARGR